MSIARPKFLANNVPLRKVSDPESLLISSLDHIVTTWPPEEKTWPGSQSYGGLFIGPTAFAYFFLHVSATRPTLLVQEKSAIQWAGEYISTPRPESKPSPESCGVLSETLSHLAVSAAITQDSKFVEDFLSHVPDLCCETGFEDWCYGRAGTLYLLRLMRTWLPSASSLINPAIATVTSTILAHGPPFVYRERRQYGVGHGEMGILTQLILSAPDPKAFISSNPAVTKGLEALLDLQLDNGTWVHSPQTDTEFVQFCHGAPGFAMALTTLTPYLTPELQARAKGAIERARDATWSRGLLTKEPNLCHGILGNAFAFPPGERREHFLSYCTPQDFSIEAKQGTYENCDYGMPFSFAFGSLGGYHPWGWYARERDGNVHFGFNDI